MLRNTSAINKLQKDMLTKTDGYVNIGTSDKSDFIVKCPAQPTPYSELNDIIQELQVLQES